MLVPSNKSSIVLKWFHLNPQQEIYYFDNSSSKVWINYKLGHNLTTEKDENEFRHYLRSGFDPIKNEIYISQIFKFWFYGLEVQGKHVRTRK
jgi:hypothetical protein